MPLQKYGVLIARATDRRLGTGQNPHYQIRLSDGEDEYRCAVNVLSKASPSELQYVVIERFDHTILTDLAGMAPGFHLLPSRPGGVALDFIRGNLFKREDVQVLPPNLPGPDNDLNEKIDHYVQRAMGDEDSLLYVFGQRWGPETQRDKIFGFKPGNGIHDIHQNQGNIAQFVGDDGVWQDGGLLLRFGDQWVAIFLRFQTQAWHTDDVTGHTIVAQDGDGGTGVDTDTEVFDPNGLVRIVAALVNAQTSPEIETVTLLNTSPNELDLTGWSIADRIKR
ncbi:MAG TPA: YukJ family protein, partial [Thermoanaerobaculia bacterium]|nr:YukJ family protein [Thermoanaerobaculia bacterium]